MKNFIATAFILLAVLSCNKNKQHVTDQIIPESKKNILATSSVIVSDSVRIEDSVSINKKISAFYSAKALVFSGIEDKVLLDSIYLHSGIHLGSYSKETLLKAIQKNEENYFEESKKYAKEFTPEYDQTWDETSDMNVFSHKKDLLIITYENSGFSGGAHGYYHIFFKNFDLKNKKTLELKDIFKDPAKMKWNQLLSSYFDNDDQKEMLLVDKIPVNNNFYIDEEGISFVYNQYEITAYAAGVITISIPYADIKSFLKPEFKQRFGIK